MACLDATTLIDLMRGSTKGRQAADAVRRALVPTQRAATTRLNVAELYVGVERGESPAREERRVRQILDGLEILEFDERAAGVFGRITAHLAARGTPAGDMDVLIASVADRVLITRNARHFEGIPGLKVAAY